MSPMEKNDASFSVTISSEVELDLEIGKTFSKPHFSSAPTNYFVNENSTI